MQTNTIRRAVYAGSFDPPTNGHLWMIREAQALFDELIVAIGINPDKKSNYTLAERIAFLQDMAKPYANVRVASYEHQFFGELCPRRGRGVLSCAASAPPAL